MSKIVLANNHFTGYKYDYKMRNEAVINKLYKRNYYLMKRVIALSVFLFFGSLSFPGYSQTGIIYIKSNPEGAKVFINNEDTKETTTFQQVLAPGKYTFKLQHDLYYNYEGQFTINDNSIERVDVALKPNFGSLRITSNPSEAECFLDGNLIGKTPLLQEKILSGKHLLELHKDRYSVLKDEIEVEDAKAIEKIYSLTAGFGSLGIKAEPDADIYINSQKVGTRIYSGQIDVGKFLIELKRERYYSQIRNIVVESGQEYIFNFELKPMTGSVSVLTTPPEAQVYLDNNLIGSSPQIIKELQIGDHLLKLVLPGFETYEQQISVLLDQSTLIKAKLNQGHLISFETEPMGAFVILDGVEKGVTPLEVPIKNGLYRLKLSKSGFYDKDTIFIAKSDEKFHFKLYWNTEKWKFLIGPESNKLVSNFLFNSDGKIIEILYDLTNDAGIKNNISVYCSQDGGKSWGNPLKKLSGDYGIGVRPGNQKKILWDALNERENLVGEIILKIVVTKN